MVKYLALIVLVGACLVGCSQPAGGDEASKGAGTTTPGESADDRGANGADSKAATL